MITFILPSNKPLLFFFFSSAYTWVLSVLCWWNQGQGSEKPIPSKSPCSMVWIWKVWIPFVSQPAAWLLASPGPSCSVGISTVLLQTQLSNSLQWPLLAAVFGKQHSDADWPKSYQCIQPCVWLCVCLCVCTRAFVHTRHTCIYT